MMKNSLIQIHAEPEEAAEVSGAGFLDIMRRAMIPLLRPDPLSLWIFGGAIPRPRADARRFCDAADATLPLDRCFFWTEGARTAPSPSLAWLRCFSPIVASADVQAAFSRI
jgi:hypothetical protein